MLAAGLLLLLAWGIAGRGGHDQPDARLAPDVSATAPTGADLGPGTPPGTFTAPPGGMDGIGLFKRRVSTLSDPEWNMALQAWAARHAEFAPWLEEERQLAAASRLALRDAPDATFEALMPAVAARMRAPEQPAASIAPLPTVAPAEPSRNGDGDPP